jgi:hypothetical protein
MPVIGLLQIGVYPGIKTNRMKDERNVGDADYHAVDPKTEPVVAELPRALLNFAERALP